MDFDQVLQRLDRFLGANPVIASDVYVAPNATLLGKVSIGSGSSVWFQSVIRADINEIRIGSETNIQDGSILHVADRYGLAIGNQVSCGHRAILHACTIQDRVLVGMNAVVMDGAEVGAGSIIGAGALLTKGTRIPPGSLVLGSPAKVVRPLTAQRAKRHRGTCREVCLPSGNIIWGRSQELQEFRSYRSPMARSTKPRNF